jgi:hypothetical protein
MFGLRYGFGLIAELIERRLKCPAIMRGDKRYVPKWPSFAQ